MGTHAILVERMLMLSVFVVLQKFSLLGSTGALSHKKLSRKHFLHQLLNMKCLMSVA